MEEINSQTLKAVSEEKDLGIIFQDDLKFTKHIYTKDQKANSMPGFALAVAIVAICEDFYFLAPKI